VIPNKSLYRVFLEYKAVVWDPDTSCGINRIERVQRKFLNFITYKLKIDHTPDDYFIVLHRLGLITALNRRD